MARKCASVKSVPMERELLAACRAGVGWYLGASWQHFTEEGGWTGTQLVPWQKVKGTKGMFWETLKKVLLG